MNDFFTNQVSHGPNLTMFDRISLFLILCVLLYVARKFYAKSWFQKVFWFILCLQIVSLYSWYIWSDWSLSESLPFYHCRLAILFLLFARKGDLKLYFSYLGLIGSLVAFIYPVFDPFPFPHLTFFTFVVGHYALAVLCLIYILTEGHRFSLSRQERLSLTVMLHLVMLFVNWLTKGNYGYLTRLPIVNSQVILFNFVLLTLVISIFIGSVQAGFQFYWKKKLVYLLQD
ncbi:TPA: TIGR02206 family membrane protein [Streptococcus suis]|nr:TIGR02206 family membrane protein [Streptococcus suis]